MKKIACSLTYLSEFVVAEKQSKIAKERDEEQLDVFNPFTISFND